MAALQVGSVDFHMRTNRELHHTMKFEMIHKDPPVPILRRGQAFNVNVTFKDRPYQADRNVAHLVFQYSTEENIACSKVLKEPGVVCSEQDVEMELQAVKQVNIGENISFTIKFQNKRDEIRKVTAALSADTVYYDGKNAYKIIKLKQQATIWANSGNSLKFFLNADSYLEKLVEYSTIKVSVWASVKETQQVWVEDHTFQLVNPSLRVTMNPQIGKGKPAKVTFQFKNPLKKPLSNCKFMYEGTGLCSPLTVDFRDVAPSKEADLEVTICPEYEGDLMLVAVFESRELSDIHGSAQVTVVES